MTKSYTYDALGNIKTISKNGVLQESYEYDALSQLTKVTYANGDVYEYSYTTNGNITETKKNGEVVNTYTYGSTQWKDKLTAFNGQVIVYDLVGNPTYYGNTHRFEWENGRRPTLVDKNGGSTVTFGYAADGNRISKTVDDVTTTYYYTGGVLYGEQIGYSKLVYLYDESGTPYGFIYNGTPYYYDKNLQGDVVGIWNKSGVRVANYTYDAWGKVLSITNQNGEDISNRPTYIGNINPLRYRGYYYDDELGLYWLNTRFYDPNTGRFVNADSTNLVAATPGSASYDKNLYAYCDNNPITRIDVGGDFWDTLFDVVSLVVSVVEVCKNPTDPLAWASLAGDAVDLIPGVTGVGETIRAAKAADTVVDVIDTVHDVSKTVDNVVDTVHDAKKIDNVIAASKPASNVASNITSNVKSARSSTVRKAWQNEVKLVEDTGVGTRVWTPIEIDELLRTGNVKGYVGHHMKSVKGYPHLAGDPANIQFLTRGEHFLAHGGNWRNVTHGRYLP